MRFEKYDVSEIKIRREADFDFFTESHTTECNTSEVMLWTIAIILIILWLLGIVSSYTLGGFIHLLLVLAIIVIVIRLLQGRTPL